ncbi:protein FAM166B isoform X1 [Trachemys scripta elegans]|uniref:protein FAM166B isoform X1 n=1 Tax=Trachemys scripta elegans TaxID=31138 RepID=UPI0015560389|nr:protein FAM166B isoform X1 [Trachemys scripta elegans]
MAAACAPKLGRSLASPDPPHGPGYAGYCPRHKFSLGTPYGQLLSGPEVTGSSQLVLQPARWPCAGAPPVGQGEALLGTRPACWGAGAHPLGCCVIPGYTGFIPRAQNLFAKTYSEICKEARSDFVRQQLRAAGKEQELQNAGRLPEGTKGKLLTAKYRTPVPAAAAPYVSPFAFQPQGSPYSMEDNNPHKCFISVSPPVTWAGFTGFVPRARFLIGAGYPLTTHRALVEFGQTRGSRPEAGKGSPVLPPLLKSYPTDMGLLPHYAGYVPGYKFQFGHTYGQLTHNALGLSTLEKQMGD